VNPAFFCHRRRWPNLPGALLVALKQRTPIVRVAAMASVGAFPLAAATTKDAVILVTLPPGAYSARVSDKTGAPGTAIGEIYEVP
jgi:hypothetical protein